MLHVLFVCKLLFFSLLWIVLYFELVKRKIKETFNYLFYFLNGTFSLNQQLEFSTTDVDKWLKLNWWSPKCSRYPVCLLILNIKIFFLFSCFWHYQDSKYHVDQHQHRYWEENVCETKHVDQVEKHLATDKPWHPIPSVTQTCHCFLLFWEEQFSGNILWGSIEFEDKNTNPTPIKCVSLGQCQCWMRKSRGSGKIVNTNYCSELIW